MDLDEKVRAWLFTLSDRNDREARAQLLEFPIQVGEI